MQGDEPITFPDAPRAELDRTLSALVDQAHRVLETQGRLRALVRANRAVVSHLELPTVLRTIVESAVELVGARYGALGVIAEGGGSLEQFIHVGMAEEDVERIGHLPEGRGLLGALIDDPRSIRIEAIDADPRSVGFPEGHPPMSAFLGVPIVVREAVYGNLYLTEPAAGRFSEDDEQLVRALAATAGFAIDNARLFAETAARQAWSASAAEMTATILGGDGSDALPELVSRVEQLTGAGLVVVLDVDLEHESAHEVARSEQAQSEAGFGEATLHNDQLRASIESSQPKRVDDVGDLDGPTGRSAGAALIVPFDGRSSRPHVLLALRDQGAPPFSGFDLERTVAFTRQAEIAMELAGARADRQRMLLLEDRARIARDLHDHVIQQLFGAGLELQSLESLLDDPAAVERIDGTVRSLDDAIAQIRTIIFALSRPRDDDAGLRHRLLDIVQEVGGSLPEPATLSFAGPVDAVADDRVADDIAAFVREGLTNVVRHAGARSASVAAKASPEEITVSIVDDGHGIGETTRRSGLGNIAERARQHDGVLEVDSDERGTRLCLRLPLAAGVG
ncbi:GAF domain-containing sensor histidine kinase [Leifsonia sp. AG29]|uniref:GAF domain-containing sensor histidine kinase n=1 Tax=Leifsonia sp. AG29 TaxID=2598860 RepID=UPI00131B13AA|nr:GAF domain-containing protein [Leifsonia sp. AG29]